MRTVCEQFCEQGASLAVPRRLTATPPAPGLQISALGVIVAALITSLGRVIAAWLQNRHGGSSWRPWNGPETRAGAGLSRWARPLHHGQGVDRHHLPSWRPAPPFLPGRTANRRGPERQERSTHPPTVPCGSRAKRST